MSDPYGLLATPVAHGGRGTRPATPTCGAIAELVAEHEVVGVVVGLPRTLAGTEGPAAAAARTFADGPGARRWRCRSS